jgi:hypothetical protein
MAWTKEYRAEYMKKYRAEHRKEINETKRYWYHHCQKTSPIKKPQKNRNEYFKGWVERNREKYNAYQREYQRKLRRKLAIDNLEKV